MAINWPWEVGVEVSPSPWGSRSRHARPLACFPFHFPVLKVKRCKWVAASVLIAIPPSHKVRGRRDTAVELQRNLSSLRRSGHGWVRLTAHGEKDLTLRRRLTFALTARLGRTRTWYHSCHIPRPSKCRPSVQEGIHGRFSPLGLPYNIAAAYSGLSSHQADPPTCRCHGWESKRACQKLRPLV